MLRRKLAKWIDSLGYEVRRQPRDLEPAFERIVPKIRPFTGVSVHRCYAMYQAIEHVVTRNIPGVFVECGVERGGSSMLAALTFLELGDPRDLYLFDTFAGMPEPTEKDVSVGGQAAKERWQTTQQDDHNAWAFAPLEDVKRNLESTGYPSERLHFVKGLVEDTIPTEAPETIAVLRLDTDWFESTWHELVHLYPRLSPGGVLYVDDYGAWLGAREAVDRYFQEHPPRPLLTRLDGGSRIGAKMVPAST